MRLLVDMNLSPRWVGLLNGAGVEAAQGSTLGAGNAPGSEIMAYAAAHSYVVLTHDLASRRNMGGQPGRLACLALTCRQASE